MMEPSFFFFESSGFGGVEDVPMLEKLLGESFFAEGHCTKKTRLHSRKLAWIYTQNDDLEKVTGPFKHGNFWYLC